MPNELRDGVLHAVREYGKNSRVTAIQTANVIHALYVAHLTSDAAVKRACVAERTRQTDLETCDPPSWPSDWDHPDEAAADMRAAILAALDGSDGDE